MILLLLGIDVNVYSAEFYTEYNAQGLIDYVFSLNPDYRLRINSFMEAIPFLLLHSALLGSSLLGLANLR